MKIYLSFKTKNSRIYNIIHQLKLQHDENASIALIINHDFLELCDRNEPKKSLIKIDFISKKNNYRCNLLTKKKEILSKAVGIKKNYFPLVLDTTAGLGRDAFILSFLGCTVIMVERNPIIAALLQDGLERAYKNEKIGYWLKKRLHLIYNNSFNMLNFLIKKPDVIYLDPMYPKNQRKTALPKKEIQTFQKLIGIDHDSYKILNIARIFAKKRIIVKRPLYAPSLSSDPVDFIIKSKKHRFDIYRPVIKK